MQKLLTALLLLAAAAPAAAQYTTPPANPACVAERNCAIYPGATRYVAVRHAGYLYPTSHWTPADEGLITVPYNTRLTALGIDDGGHTIYVEYQGVRGWMLGVFTSANPQTSESSAGSVHTGIEAGHMASGTPSAYPNPAPGRVTIEGEGNIFDALGRFVKPVRDEAVNLAPGAYFFRGHDGALLRFVVI